MKILIPILGFARQGGYRVLSELANSWIRMGHECSFLVPSTSGDPYFPTSANIIYSNKSGCDSQRKNFKKANGLDNVLSLYVGLKSVGKEYDVILANHSLTAWPVWLANCDDASKFYYIQAYEPDYYPWFRHPLKNVLSKLSYLLNLNRIANSESYKENNIKFMATIPPGIDLSIFNMKEAELDIASKDEIIIGTIGRSEAYKGTSTAIAAYKNVQAKNPRLKLRVAFGNVKASNDFEIIKIKNDSELSMFYQSIDVLLVSCYSQHGAPHYPLIEAMACGTPVIHTDYFPGDKSNSWVAESSSLDAVIAALEDFLKSSSEIRLKKIFAARKKIEENLSWDSVAQNFIGRFNERANKNIIIN